MVESETLTVEVAFALPEVQKIVRVQLPNGSKVQDAVNAAGLAREFPEYDFSSLKLGIWSKLVKADAALRDRDRVEVYRPLIADPKEVRKQRAAAGKVMKKGTAEGGDSAD